VIFEIPEAHQHVWMSAFNTRPENVQQLFSIVADKYPTVSVQMVDLDTVPGHRYLSLATVNAFKSFHSKQSIARTLTMELLLYISGQKQIGEALSRVGITPKTRRVAALAVGESTDQLWAASKFLTNMLGQAGEDQLLDKWPQTRIDNVRLGFDIGDKELRAATRKKEAPTVTIERLAVERSAMLAGRK
jgi:tRNA threonylcarbamoyladenosine modification (KEOPS) complex Cgi121 subunit